MKITRFAVFLSGILCMSCSIHLSPNRVQRADLAVRPLLVEYCRAQRVYREETGRYDRQLTPDVRGARWSLLMAAYEAVQRNEYTCRFDVQEVRFAVTCAPEPSSKLFFSYYADDSAAIRRSHEGLAGPSSPRLRLTRIEALRLEADSPAEPRGSGK